MEIDDRKCTACKNCNYKETVLDKNGKDCEMWFCGRHRTMITDLTRPSWIIGCKGNDFELRVK